MKRNELSEQLLTSERYALRSRQLANQSTEEDANLTRLYRKFNETLRELQIERKVKKSGPFLCPFIFRPQSLFIIGWQILNIMLIYLYFLQIPIILAFENHRAIDANQRLFQIINIPTIVIFLCGMLINLNTGFYKDGLLKTDPLQIRRHYLKKSFLLDIISILAIAVYEILEITKQFQNRALKLFVLAFYLKALELVNIQSTINRSFDLNRRTKAAFKLFLLLMKIVLICNIVACSGFYISYNMASAREILYPDGTPCTDQCYWVMNVKYAGVSLFDYDGNFSVQYSYSLYWASTTMISIGYGDITPKNPTEVAFTIVIQFLSCLLYGYSINQIWSIVQQLNMKKMKIHSRLNLINVYMRDKAISPEVTSKVNAYLNNYYYAKNLRERETEAEIIGELTPALRKELFYQSYSSLFSHQYFKITNINLKQNICEFVKEVGYYQAEMVFMDINKQPCLYYVKRGELRYETGDSSHTFIKNYYKNDVLGIYEFFTQLYFKSELQANSYSLLFYLSSENWRRVLKNYRVDFQRYYQTKDQLILYKSGGVIGYRCEFCSSNYHRTEDCFQDQLYRYVKTIVTLTKSGQNYRKFYPRREFKLHLHQRHDRHRKRSTIKASEYRGKAQTTSVYIRPYDQPPRKHSQQHFTLKNVKAIIRNQKGKHQNLKALEKIRKAHPHNDIQNISNQSESIYQLQFQEFNIDAIAEYEEYYPSFNVKSMAVREGARRRLTRSMMMR